MNTYLCLYWHEQQKGWFRFHVQAGNWDEADYQCEVERPDAHVVGVLV